MKLKRKSSPGKSRWLLYTFFYLFFACVVTAIVIVATLPNVDKLKWSLKIDRKISKGETFVTVPYVVGEKNPDFVPLEKISKHLIHAVIVAEDIEFFTHSGFNFDEIKESIKKNISNGSFVRGASTITQQLMKNIYLSGEKTFYRKLKEAMLTYRAERTLTKNRILELYLNVIEWGDNIFGIKQASKHYFNKDPGSLSVYESAFLASLIPAPRKYSKPKKNSRLEALLQKRRNTIVWWMEKAGYLSSSWEATDRTPVKPQADEKPSRPGTLKIPAAKTMSPKKVTEPLERKQVASQVPAPTPRATLDQNEDKELVNMIEEFQPEEVFKGSESFKAPADTPSPTPKK